MNTTNPAVAPAVGDLVLVSIPFSQGQGDKKRPALVMSTPDACGDVLMVSITSNAAVPGGLPIGPADLAAGQLHAASWLRPEKLNSIDAQRIDRVIGRASPALLHKLRAVMCPLLGCA